jgi:hypothetical protein
MPQVSFWTDWQFWQLVVAAAGALLGFFGGTLITHSLDRKRDREKEQAAAKSLAVAPHAEISAIRAKAGQLFGSSGLSARVPGYHISWRVRSRPRRPARLAPGGSVPRGGRFLRHSRGG